MVYFSACNGKKYLNTYRIYTFTTSVPLRQDIDNVKNIKGKGKKEKEERRETSREGK